MNYSFIIPIYKVEELLRRCVESVVSACSNADEIILIDDGSPDRSGQVADELANEYHNVHVIHKCNGGLSDARNEGLKKSNGEYIVFVDSDDYINAKEFEKLRLFMSEYPDEQIYYCDIMRLQFGMAPHRMIKRNVEIGRNYSGVDFLKKELSSGKFQAMAQCGIYARKFLIQNHLFFEKRLLHEDEEWSPRVLLMANNVIYTDICFYRYELRTGSITQMQNKKANAIAQLQICRKHQILCGRQNDFELQRYWKRYLAKMYMNAWSVGYCAGLLIPVDKKYIEGTWVSIGDFFRFQIFLRCPRVYALIMKQYMKRNKRKTIRMSLISS